MPDLTTALHLQMFGAWKRTHRLRLRLASAISALRAQNDIYGLEWGDPESCPPLSYVRDHFLKPYVSDSVTVLEIGPGGGRWTRYFSQAHHIYAVDFHQELLDELKSNFRLTNITFIKNSGDDFPQVPQQSVDFLFSFGTFVHLDIDIIRRYLMNMKSILKEESNVVIQYSDKLKPLARVNKGFSDNHPEAMRKLVLSCGYTIYEEDTQSLWHSSVIRFGLKGHDPKK